MSANPTNAYLRDAVMTATPEQLQLMLYDGAIRFASQGREAIEKKDFEKAYETLSRSQKIVLEMQQGLRHEVAPELCDRMAALYSFIYRRLIDGAVEKDIKAIDDALDILRYERETWVLLMDKLKEAKSEITEEPTQAEVPEGSSLSVEG